MQGKFKIFLKMETIPAVPFSIAGRLQKVRENINVSTSRDHRHGWKERSAYCKAKRGLCVGYLHPVFSCPAMYIFPVYWCFEAENALSKECGFVA
jgi:hypothetical protein